MAEFYIYYRIEPSDEAAYETQMRAMQARLACSTAVTARLLKSCSDPAMRMEVYRDIADAELFLGALEQAVSRFEIDLFLASGERRHLECFSE